MSSTNARIVESTRGGKVLEHMGFRYTKRSHNRNQTRIYWRCEQSAMVLLQVTLTLPIVILMFSKFFKIFV